MEFLKKSWKAIAGVVGAIVGFILLRQFFTKDLLAKLALSKSDKDSAVLDEKIAGVKQDQAAAQSEADRLRAEANKPAEQLDPKAVEDYWNKK